MFKRGVILIGIFILLFSFSVDAVNKPRGTMFITSQTYQGNFGDANGDSICQQAANNANLEGNWIALYSYRISANEVDTMTGKVSNAITFYWLDTMNFYRMDGELIKQPNYELFFHDDLMQPIDVPILYNEFGEEVYNEFGEEVPEGRYYWTGSDQYGQSGLAPPPPACSGWSVNNAQIYGNVGNSHTTNWLFDSNIRCDQRASLLCMKIGPTCNNYILENGETCEGNHLREQTCAAEGFEGGNLRCLNDCSGYDTSGCYGASYVFASNTYSSNLDGIRGAHQKCRTEASNAGLEGWWKAWISVNSEAQAKNFIRHSSLPYVLLDDGNTIIANDWSDLTDESLDHAINKDERGNDIENRYVFTNTYPNGNVIWGENDDRNCGLGGINSCDCRDFTYAHDVSDGSAEVFKGNTTRSNSEWTNYLYLACSSRESAKARLYCFQQEFDGDADRIDCGIALGRWVYNRCGLEQCDTFHDWDGYREGYCCGDDDREIIIIARIGDSACCMEGVHTCVINGQCQTGLEGINYFGTCSDGKDNDCDTDVDNEDLDCASPTPATLTVTNNNLCDYQTQSFGINFKNRGNNVVEVSITDQIYNSNNQLINTKDKHCEGVNAGESCIDNYPLNLNVESYYHNIVAVYADNQRITKNNYNGFNVLANDNVACCVPEGTVPTGGRICCDGLPTDGLNGACGCPNGFVFDPTLNQGQGGCKPSAGRICYSSEANERESNFLACTFVALTQNWWNDAFNFNNLIDFQNCFRWHRDNEPLTQTCCPYTEYGGKQYGEYKNIEVY